MSIGRRVGARDPTIGGAEEIKECVCEPREGASELLEFEKPKPGELAGASSVTFVECGIGSGRAADLDGEQSVVGLV